MNNDLISRSALKDEIVKLCERINANNGITVPTLAFTRIIDNAPTVEPEPISDYQKRALELADNLKDKGVINNRERGTLRRAILLEPERPKGEWIKDGSSSIAYRCSNCEVLQHWSPIKNGKYNFCPNCGADMRGEKE